MTHTQERYQLGWRATACLLLAGIADFLFYRAGMGWTVAIYTLTILSAILFFNRRLTLSKPNWVIIAINLVLVLALIENPSGLTITLSFLGITSICLASHPGWIHNAWLWLKGVFSFWVQNVFRVFTDVKLFKYLLEEKRNPGQMNIQLKNWILPIGLSLLFVVLFAGANPIFIRWLDLIDWAWVVEQFTFERILLWSLVIIFCWPLLQPKFQLKQQSMQDGDFKGTRELVRFLFSKESILYSLILFNLLFSVQTSMDTLYLWGGKALPEGMSYAEYAHRGAYPLIATALLAGAFVLIALRPGSETEAMRLIRYLVYLWIGQNIFLVLSSIWRTTLYIEEYSLTYLRLAALIWMGLVALGLVWLILRIAWTRSNIWLLNINGATLLMVLLTCTFINLGSIIAHFNVQHCKEVNNKGPALDLKYLEEIGTASLPALGWFQRQGNPYHYKTSKALTLERNFRSTLNRQLREWRTWTFRSYRLSLNSGVGGNLKASSNSPRWTIAPDKNELR